MDKTPIYLNEEEMKVFIWIWEKYEALKKAKDDCHPGNITLHCNKSGKIKGTDIHISDKDI